MRSRGLLLPSSVEKAEQTEKAAAAKVGQQQVCIWSVCVCVRVWGGGGGLEYLVHAVKPYRGRGRQDDVFDGGFELVDGGSVLMRAVVRLDGLDFHVELPGFVFVLRVAGRVEGIVFGM